jgi:CRP-like cAMP-binding protein
VKIETGPRAAGRPGTTRTREDQAIVIVRRLEDAGVPVARRSYDAGELVYASGDADRYLCFLLEGQVRVYKPYGAYKEATVALLGEGVLFGEPSLRPSGGHRDSAEALTDCQVARVSKVALEQHVARDPACALALMAAFCKWARQREQLVAAPAEGRQEPPGRPAPGPGRQVRGRGGAAGRHRDAPHPPEARRDGRLYP